MNRLTSALSVVTNPKAGRSHRRNVLSHVRARLSAAGADVEYLTSQSADHAEELAEQVVGRNRTVVACGGDGHVGRLASVAARRSAPFGLIPTGTGNDFAAELSLSPDQPDVIADTILVGRLRTIDLGRIGDRFFCSVAGCGFSSQANQWANRQHWIGGTALYVTSVIRTLATYRPRPLRLSIDGTIMEISAWLVAVANGRALGGGMLIAPDAQLDDGALDVVVIGPVSRFEFLRTFPKVFDGTHVHHPQISTASGTVVEIEPIGHQGEPLLVYADGEHAGSLPLRFEVAENQLQVLAPGL